MGIRVFILKLSMILALAGSMPYAQAGDGTRRGAHGSYQICAVVTKTNYLKVMKSYLWGAPLKEGLARLPHASLGLMISNLHGTKHWVEGAGRYIDGSMRDDRLTKADVANGANIKCKPVERNHFRECRNWIMEYRIALIQRKFQSKKERGEPQTLKGRKGTAPLPTLSQVASRVKAKGYDLFNYNCADFLAEAWLACTGRPLNVKKVFGISNPLSVRP